jgi:hypothetical protein
MCSSLSIIYINYNLQRRACGSHDYETQIMRSMTESYVTLRNTLRSLCYVALHVWQLHQN